MLGHNLWPTIMLDDSEDAKDFEGFDTYSEKTLATELLRYAKWMGTTVIVKHCENYIVDWMHCDSEAL